MFGFRFTRERAEYDCVSRKKCKASTGPKSEPEMVLLEVIREKESPLTGAWGIMRSRKGLADDTRGKAQKKTPKWQTYAQ